MEVKKYRAKNMYEALAWVREELGPQAVILQAQEVETSRLFGLLPGKKQVEITAASEGNVPSLLSAGVTAFANAVNSADAASPVTGNFSESVPQKTSPAGKSTLFAGETSARKRLSSLFSPDEIPDGVYSARIPRDASPETLDMRTLWSDTEGVSDQHSAPAQINTTNHKLQTTNSAPARTATPLKTLFETRWDSGMTDDFPAFSQVSPVFPPAHPFTRSPVHLRSSEDEKINDVFLQLYAELIDADLDDPTAHGLLERLRKNVGLADPAENPRGGKKFPDVLPPEARDLSVESLRNSLLELVKSSVQVTGPIHITPGKRRIAALVGPTGVGKTTTLAKLAAIYKLRENCRVGLMTLDTFRVAAVEQLKTYSDIIRIPMQVVSSPREIQEALRRMADFDLILIDTTGRSQRDDLRIHELRSYLLEAGADEIHLVLSATTRPRVLKQVAEQFSVVGTTSLIVTKLDESAGLGNLLPLVESSQLPISYVTNGQNVPEDIETADTTRLARWILGMDKPTGGESGAMQFVVRSL